MTYRVRAAIACIVGAVVTSGGLLRGEQAPQEPPSATFRSSVEAVQVSVIVTDENDRPVEGLTAADFEVLERSESRPITTFIPMNLPIDDRPTPVGELDVRDNTGAAGRLYVIALDQMSADNALRMRHILREFIETHFRAEDSAAVMLLTSGPRDSGQEFTSDSRLLLRAIDRFSGGSGGASGAPHAREKNFMGDFKALTARG